MRCSAVLRLVEIQRWGISQQKGRVIICAWYFCAGNRARKNLNFTQNSSVCATTTSGYHPSRVDSIDTEKNHSGYGIGANFQTYRCVPTKTSRDPIISFHWSKKKESLNLKIKATGGFCSEMLEIPLLEIQMLSGSQVAIENAEYCTKRTHVSPNIGILQPRCVSTSKNIILSDAFSVSFIWGNNNFFALQTDYSLNLLIKLCYYQ